MLFQFLHTFANAPTHRCYAEYKASTQLFGGQAAWSEKYLFGNSTGRTAMLTDSSLFTDCPQIYEVNSISKLQIVI